MINNANRNPSQRERGLRVERTAEANPSAGASHAWQQWRHHHPLPAAPHVTRSPRHHLPCPPFSRPRTPHRSPPLPRRACRSQCHASNALPSESSQPRNASDALRRNTRLHGRSQRMAPGRVKLFHHLHRTLPSGTTPSTSRMPLRQSLPPNPLPCAGPPPPRSLSAPVPLARPGRRPLRPSTTAGPRAQSPARRPQKSTPRTPRRAPGPNARPAATCRAWAGYARAREQRTTGGGAGEQAGCATTATASVRPWRSIAIATACAFAPAREREREENCAPAKPAPSPAGLS